MINKVYKNILIYEQLFSLYEINSLFLKEYFNNKNDY